MKRTIIILCLAAMAGWLSSCQKDTDIFIPGPSSGTGLDTVWASSLTDQSPVNILKTALVKERVLDSLDISTGATIITREGLTVTVLPQSLLLPAGTAASGKIYVETFLVKQKGDMVRMDKPTTSNGRILISGGEVFVRFRKETEELHLAPGKNIYVKFSEATPSTQMKLFYGDESNPERFNWLPNTDSSQLNSLRINLDSYELSATKLRWINCDYFGDSSGTRSKITASLPVDYTNANTAVYLVFKDQRTVMSMYGDFNTKKFSVANIPSGKLAIVISITRKGNNSYYLGHETITTGASGTTSGGQIIPLSPQPTSLADIKTYLATL